MRRRRVFRIWLAVLTVACVFVNVPHPFTKLGATLWYEAGCPWRYGVWDRGWKLEEFDPAALASDGAVWLGLVGVAWLCAWSRTRPGGDIGVRAEGGGPGRQEATGEAGGGSGVNG